MTRKPAPDRIAVFSLGNVRHPLTVDIARAGFDQVGLELHGATTKTMQAENDLKNEVANYGVAALRHDPWVGAKTLAKEHDIAAEKGPGPGQHDPIIVADGHREVIQQGSKVIRALGKADAMVYDIKGIFGNSGSGLRL